MGRTGGAGFGSRGASYWLNAGDNAVHACEAFILSGTLRSALAQAISLTDLLRLFI